MNDFVTGYKGSVKKGLSGALSSLLCADPQKGPDHRGLLYATLPFISARGCFHGCNFTSSVKTPLLLKFLLDVDNSLRNIVLC